MVPVRYFDLAQPIQLDELPLGWRLAAAPFDRNGKVKQIYLSPVSDDFAAELLDEFGDRWPPAAFSNGGGPPAADWHDARAVLVKRIGQPLTTLRGRPNRILEVGEADVTVATNRSPDGQPVPIVWVQQALDRLVRDGEVIISPEVIGYRSAFIGAVLRTLPGVAVGMDPPRVWLEDTHHDRDTGAARRRRHQREDAALTSRLLEAITGLRRWTRDGRAAVHKPLLLLLALERVRRGLPRLVSFVEVEPQLRALITEFSPMPGPSHPEYPFWRLQADGLWDVPEASQLPSRASNSDPPVSVLRARRVEGGLPIVLDELVRARGDVLDQAVTATLQHFPAELRPQVLERLGWDDIPTIPTQRARRPRSSERTAPLGVPYQEGLLAVPRRSGCPIRRIPTRLAAVWRATS
jgi:hypothetical protein